jgi:outer membrane protein assembly factor BamD
MKQNILTFFIALVFLAGCSTKEDIEYNKPAMYWYQKITYSIAKYNLDKADDYFSSLQSEHIESVFVPEAMMLLAQAHIEEEEYILAIYYLDEYEKRFAKNEEKAYIDFLKLKAKFYAFEQPKRNQQLLKQSISEINRFLLKYPNSEHIPVVKTMLIRFLLSEYTFNNAIKEIYIKLDKPKAADFYNKKVKYAWMKKIKIEPAKVFWIRALFE